MALPSTGAISMSQVATELGISATGINLNLASVRKLAGKTSGIISMSDLRGKTAAVFSGTSITVSIKEVELRWEHHPDVGEETMVSTYGLLLSSVKFIDGSSAVSLANVSGPALYVYGATNCYIANSTGITTVRVTSSTGLVGTISFNYAWTESHAPDYNFVYTGYTFTISATVVG